MSLGGTNSRGNGVSDWGLVGGFSNLAGDTARRATLWFHGRAFDLNTLGGTNSSVAWANKMYPNLIYWNEVERGGHFAAFEEPGLFVDELRSFKRAMPGL